MKKYIDKADEKSLRMVQAILEIEEGYDLWDDLPQVVKDDVDEAIEQVKDGKGSTQNAVMKKYSS